MNIAIKKAWIKKQRYFVEKYQSNTNGIFSKEESDTTKHVKDFLRLKKPASILDIGCGSADVPAYIPDSLKKVYSGIDPLDIERTYPCLVAPINEAAINKAYDCILCISTLDHIAEPYQVAIKVKKWLKPNGYFILTIASYESSTYQKFQNTGRYTEPDPNHVWHFNIKDILRIFSNYKLIKAEHTVLKQYIIIFQNAV